LPRFQRHVRALEDVLNPPERVLSPMPGERAKPLTAETNLTRELPMHPDDAPRQRGLTRAGFTHNCYAFLGANRYGHAVEHAIPSISGTQAYNREQLGSDTNMGGAPRWAGRGLQRGLAGS